MPTLINPGEATGTPPVNPRPVGDVFCPFFKLAFTNQLGATGTVSRQVNGDDVGTVRIQSQVPDQQQLLDTVVKSAASLTIESKAGSPFKFTLDMTPDYEDGVRILESQIISYLTIVSVNWGYVTTNGGEVSAGEHHFRVLEPRATFGEDMRISVVGYDLASDTNMRTTTCRQWNRTTYPRDLDILATLCNRTGYVLKADLPLLSSTIAKPITPESDTGDSNSPVQLCTDWQFFNSLCRKHGVSFVILRGNEILLFDPFSPPPDAQQFVYTFKWRKAPAGGYDIPVYNIAGTILPSAFLPPAGAGVFAVQVDNTTGTATFVERSGQDLPSTKEAVKRELTAEQQAIINAGMSATAQSTPVPGNTTLNPGPVQESDQTGTFIDLSDYDARGAQVNSTVTSQADNLVREAAFFSNPKVKIRCPGVLDIYPGRLVKVEGTGKIYDYTYTVLSVKHILGNNGYDMEVELIRQGVRTAQNAVYAPPQTIEPISPSNDSSTTASAVDENAAPPI